MARLGAAILIGIALLTMAACGSDDPAAAERSTTQQRTRSAGAATASHRCQSQLGSFLRSLNTLHRRLAIGLSYDRYLYDVRKVRTAYAEVATDRLALDCLVKIATPAEKALNRYMAAANTWGECLSTVSCGTESVEPHLQRQWKQASDLLAAARGGLRSAGVSGRASNG